VGEGVDRKVFPQGWGRDLAAPIEGEVDGGEAFREVPGRVLGPKGGERGERWRESCRRRVRVWGGAGYPKGGQSPSVPAVRDNRGEAGLAAQNGGGGGVEVVRRPSLDSVPEAVHASERGVCRGEEVGAIREYGAEETGGDAVA